MRKSPWKLVQENQLLKRMLTTAIGICLAAMLPLCGTTHLVMHLNSLCHLHYAIAIAHPEGFVSTFSV